MKVITKLERVIKDIYRFRLVEGKDADLGKCNVYVNLQDFFDEFNIPKSLYYKEIK